VQAFAYPDDKGKPPEREGRKAVGLNLTRGMIARLPNRGFYIWACFLFYQLQNC